MAVVFIAEIGRLLRQDSPDNRPFADTEKIAIWLTVKLEEAYFYKHRDNRCQYVGISLTYHCTSRDSHYLLTKASYMRQRSKL
jgi:hypothetical protein